MALSGKVVKCSECKDFTATIRFNQSPLCEGCYYNLLMFNEQNSFYAAKSGVRGLIRFMKSYL